jgi:hypothetical protein
MVHLTPMMDSTENESLGRGADGGGDGERRGTVGTKHMGGTVEAQNRAAVSKLEGAGGGEVTGNNNPREAVAAVTVSSSRSANALRLRARSLRICAEAEEQPAESKDCDGCSPAAAKNK